MSTIKVLSDSSSLSKCVSFLVLAQLHTAFSSGVMRCNVIKQIVYQSSFRSFSVLTGIHKGQLPELTSQKSKRMWISHRHPAKSIALARDQCFNSTLKTVFEITNQNHSLSWFETILRRKGVPNVQSDGLD
jgi:hypothetical protein